jgi:hypothetical protein
MQWLAAVNQGRDNAERIDLQIFRRMMFHPGHVDLMAFIGEALLREARRTRRAKRSNASRGEGSSWLPPGPEQLMADHAIRNKLMAVSAEPSTPHGFAAYIKTGIECWAMIKKSGATFE